jgi:hypothetical protein
MPPGILSKGPMTSKQWVIGAAAGAAVALTVLISQCWMPLYQKNVAFEARAVAADARATAAQVVADSFKAVAKVATASAAHRDTVILHDSARIDSVDRAHPADTSCAPNLAARDTTIRDQMSQIGDLKTASRAQMATLAILQASKDDLQHALDTRPKLYPRFVGPSIGFGVFAGYCGTSKCLGVGLTLNFGSIRVGGGS